MENKIMTNKFVLIGIVGVSVFILIFIITSFVIGNDIHSKCTTVIREYKSDCVSSMINVLNDENKTMRERNSAVWVLGQLGDRWALQALQKYYTGSIPPREPLDKTISQHELKKAIRLINGSLNLTTLIWKHNLPSEQE